jgi:hypothetical protein
MFFHKKPWSIAEPLARTIFFTSLVSYVAFWIVDAVRPGFVSRYLSVHLFLLVSIFSGVWWSIEVPSLKERPWISFLICGFFSLVFAVWCWKVDLDLVAARLWFSLFGFISLWIFYFLMRDK